jgi:cytochrome o ubiquinol oxidase subunit 2
VRRYATVDPTLYKAILNRCVEPGKMCMSEMMAIDAKGGLGKEGVKNTLPLTYDKYARRGAVFGADPSYVASVCTIDELDGEAPNFSASVRRMMPVTGAGLKRPENISTRPPAASSLIRMRSQSDS